MGNGDVGVRIVEATRGDVVENRFTAHVVVVRDREVVACVGNPGLVSPMRSTAKPFLASFVAQRAPGEFSAAELALIASSHSGEERHTRQLRAMLVRLGFAAEWLSLGRHPVLEPTASFDPPLSGPFGTRLQNNCSGKHIGLMRLAQLLGQDPRQYADLDGAALRWVASEMARVSAPFGPPPRLMLDGCGITNFGLPLASVAKLYASLFARQTAVALRDVRDAMLANPYEVGGKGRAATAILRRGLVAKDGFDGLFALAFARRGVPCAIVVRLDSGSDVVAREVAVRLVELLTGESFTDGDYSCALTVRDQTGAAVGRLTIDDGILKELLADLPG